MRWKTSKISGWARSIWAEQDLSRADRLNGLLTAARERFGPAIGNLRSYGDAALNSGGVGHVTTRLDRVLDFDVKAGVISAEAGITISDLLQIMLPKGWMPPVMPGTGFATLGGVIAADAHGKNHHVQGSIGRYVRSISLLMADGSVKKLSLSRNKDLFRATIGGMGQTGIILSAEIDLFRASSNRMDVRESRMENLADFLASLDASKATYAVGWLDVTARGAKMGRGILEEAEVSKTDAVIKSKRTKSVPFNAPKSFLSRFVVRWFNALYLRRVSITGKLSSKPMADFFFPLDKINDWNKLYGKVGFAQFQCVIPEENAHIVLGEMLEAIGEARLASPLVVLKRMGEGKPGILSFPMKGYTLAVDIPMRANSGALFARLHLLTRHAEGRIYLAKDSMAVADDIPSMYSDLDEWRAIVAKADPDGVFETDLARRLNLRGTL